MTNLELAQVFEDAIGHLHRNPLDSSCYAIAAVSGFGVDETWEWESSPIVRMLKSRVFKPHEYIRSNDSLRTMRPLWLTLLAELAELAERGDLTIEGLR